MFSINRLAAYMIGLLIAVAVLSTLGGFLILSDHYQTAEQRFRSENERKLQQASAAIAERVAFYQGILDLIVRNPKTGELIEFGEPGQIQEWAQTVRDLLPMAFGMALSDETGKVIGDATIQRVGPACQADLHSFAQRGKLDYPPFHLNIPGFEHFDLFTPLKSIDGSSQYTLLISFKLDALEDVLKRYSSEGTHWSLLDAEGRDIIQVGAAPDADGSRLFAANIPSTAWMLQLQARDSRNVNDLIRLISVNLLIIVLFGAAVTFGVQRYAGYFRRDMENVHRTMLDLLNGSFSPYSYRPTLKETEELFPDLERLASQLQEQNEQLKTASTTDPMTGLFNRRQFDILLDHAFEQSKRGYIPVLLLLDVNLFKNVNDQLGHKNGDEALMRIANFLTQSIRTSDSTARVGGDEFAIILENMSLDSLETWLDRFIARYDEHLPSIIPAGLPDGCCTLSIGVTLINAGLYHKATDTYHAADVAMYHAKVAETDISRYEMAVTDSFSESPDEVFDSRNNPDS